MTISTDALWVLLRKLTQRGPKPDQPALNLLQLFDQLDGFLATQTGYLVGPQHDHTPTQVL